MANTAQARKRARQSEKRRAHNTSLRSELRTAIKKVRKAIARRRQGRRAGRPRLFPRRHRLDRSQADRASKHSVALQEPPAGRHQGPALSPLRRGQSTT